MTIPSLRSLIFEVKSTGSKLAFIRVLRLGLDNFAFGRLRTSLEIFGLLRKTSDFFGNLRKWSYRLQKSQHSQDKNLMLISHKKLAGILLGSHLSKSLHCSICPKDQFITKATFLDLAVCQVSFCTKTWYLQMWKFRVIFTCEKITVATAT